ncbi:MAG: IS66 family transposase [Halobacteriovoraceae bacterium]|nr:IS66 family transposase [Halobacteriovoraceae bacterium]
MGLYKLYFKLNSIGMNQQYLFEPIPNDKYDLLTKDELIQLHKSEQNLNHQLQKYIEKLHNKITSAEQKSFLLEEQTINIKHRLFGKSSEKSDKPRANNKDKKPPRKRVLLPSERYPNIDVMVKDVELDELPNCPCCQSVMQDSGLTEDSEYLTVIPKRYYVVKQKRHKYRCSSCQGALVTAPAIPRVKSGSSYSDEMTIDVALSKYCDLIPVERYAAIAERQGVAGLPANSLIQSTHSLADYLEDVYKSIKLEILKSKVLHADETPHRMLEGDKKSHWYLWGFSTDRSAYFEARDTRSGEVASELLKESDCEFLVSDVFSGYRKAVRVANENRDKKIQIIYCNAHARRKFKESEKSYENESDFFLRCYEKIYGLEKNKDFKSRRSWQRIYFKAMEAKSLRTMNSYSKKSSLVKAMDYLIKNFDELTRFTNYQEVPIDNNSQERLLRSPVIGRKTWYGTHSKRGAKTNSILFSLVESCKLNKVNPREYFKEIVFAIHQNQSILTPAEYKNQQSEKIA